MNTWEWLWPTFGCKVGQSVWIVIKLELDLWHCPPDVYTKFQIDISKHVEKIITKILKIEIFTTKLPNVNNYTVGHLSTKLEGFILIYEAMIAKMSLTYFCL